MCSFFQYRYLNAIVKITLKALTQKQKGNIQRFVAKKLSKCLPLNLNHSSIKA